MKRGDGVVEPFSAHGQDRERTGLHIALITLQDRHVVGLATWDCNTYTIETSHMVPTRIRYLTGASQPNSFSSQILSRFTPSIRTFCDIDG